jgi:UDP-N-acetylmuramoylalanine--D-glutamate ligase
MEKKNFPGMKVLVMGLGLHGGGLESVLYLAGEGAEVTVTDLRDEKALASSIEKLEEGIRGAAFPVRYVLGRHETGDFEKADMVIKNPGVPPDSPYLKAARRIETDISLFLAASPARILAVTGSKGKSTVSSALHRVLAEAGSAGLLQGRARLGGNIAVSPLSFLKELEEGDRVVLELSSWQLGDLKDRVSLLKPRCAVITAIMRDHQDRYGSMEAYVDDKRVIYRGQDEEDATVAGDDGWGQSFLRESRGRPLVCASGPLPLSSAGGWICGKEGNGGEDGPGLARLWAGKDAGRVVEAVPEKLLTPGRHQKRNLLSAALALLDLGLPPDFVRTSLGRFTGIEHRLEFFHQARGIRFYNDSAATIPEAAAAAVYAFEKPLVLVSGGADKDLDFSPLVQAAPRAKALILLEGTGSAKLSALLDGAGVPYRGPFDSLDGAIKAALEAAESGDSVVLSPGCASFGMFLNEFDRGKKWKEGVLKWT